MSGWMNDTEKAVEHAVDKRTEEIAAWCEDNLAFGRGAAKRVRAKFGEKEKAVEENACEHMWSSSGGYCRKCRMDRVQFEKQKEQEVRAEAKAEGKREGLEEGKRLGIERAVELVKEMVRIEVSTLWQTALHEALEKLRALLKPPEPEEEIIHCFKNKYVDVRAYDSDPDIMKERLEDDRWEYLGLVKGIPTKEKEA